jgi:hypothetical protein
MRYVTSKYQLEEKTLDEVYRRKAAVSSAK